MDDPEIFHADAKLVVTGRAVSEAQDVLLYIKNNKLYQASPCCGLLCCGSSQRLSKIEKITVVTGTVKLLNHLGTHVVKVHRINLGLKITLSNWYGKRIKVYDTPDAVELARRMDHHFREAAPTRIDMTFKQPPPGNAAAAGGGVCSAGVGGCH